MESMSRGSTGAARDVLHQAAERIRPSQEKLVGDFRTLITDADQLMKSIASASGEGMSVARDRFASQLESAKHSYEETERALRARVENATDATAQYVSRNPIQAVAIAAAVGLVLGMLTRHRD
ncbi:MAG: DUF883 domain-containing protein [Proteobacteria bacterium]|nr:DUF883 domain-containing protein [Burkholderiales bacterium]